MQGLSIFVDILVMLTNVLVMLIIVQFIIGLLFAFNVV
ncbi:MAG: YggT family protein, partial [Sphingomonadales bacterium 32-67-7]